ncbi:hypothetical protein [Intrasporangium sp.]|uniref:hypothetical protein n=1 Tax=Intrasporangium sp. TaxID=1925024 RepID=UPI003221C526
MSDTWGVRVCTRQVTAARITGEDGAHGPSSWVRALRHGQAVADGLYDLLREAGIEGARLVADVSPVLDAWLAQQPTGHNPGCRLGRVTVVRVAPSPRAIADPFTDWPAHLSRQLDGGWLHLTGGIDLHGGRVIPTDTSRIGEAIRLAEQQGSVAICVSAMGALLDSQVEYSVAEQLVRLAPPCPVVLAHTAGGRRFLEREKSAVLAAALLPATAGLLDDLETATARTGSALCLAGADGARLGVEDARAMPTRLLGATNALIAQGAAALAGLTTAVILLWVGDHARLLTMRQGVLRTQLVRRSTQLGDLRFSQRNAVQSILTGPAAADLTRDLVEDRPTVLTRITAADNRGFEAFTAVLSGQLPDVHVVTEDPPLLAALGARASLPQSEIIKYAVASSNDEVQQMRHLLVQIAQGRVLAATDRPVELRTLTDHHAPLSFLLPGPVLLRVHVVGLPIETS